MNALTDKIVVITGASSGIGKECARLFGHQGAKLALLARRKEALEEIASSLPASATCIACDVTSEQSVTEAFAAVREQLGEPDILINNAGTGFATDLATCSIDDYRRIIETNLTGVFLATRAVLPAMKARQSGHIINISSVVGKVANPGAPLYCASKHGLNGYTSGLQQQVAKDGIRVSSVSPSAVDTAYWDGREVDRTKFLKAEEVAAAVAFVANQPDGVLIKDIDLTALR